MAGAAHRRSLTSADKSGAVFNNCSCMFHNSRAKLKYVACRNFVILGLFKDNRKALYDLVWSKPMTQVAKEYGLSDRGTPQQGTPTRRAKIRYFLHLQGMNSDELEEFVEKDMESIIELFKVFNEGTHGQPGTFDKEQLLAIRKRVEDGIIFLSKLLI